MQDGQGNVTEIEGEESAVIGLLRGPVWCGPVRAR